MHRELRAAFLERGLQLLHEQALAADLGQGAVEDLVAPGGHAEQVDGQAMALHEQVAHVVGLPEGEAAFAGGDQKGGRHDPDASAVATPSPRGRVSCIG